jgi:hypothetical protein
MLHRRCQSLPLAGETRATAEAEIVSLVSVDGHGSRACVDSMLMNAPSTSRALEHLLCGIGNPIVELDGIGRGHPEFNRAQTLRAAAGIIAKVPAAMPAVAQAVRGADVAAASERTRAHFAAAETWLAGNPILAAESYAFVLSRWPRDLLALRLAESCYFFLGQHERLCAVIDGVLPAWPEQDDAFKYVLAMAAFAHAENGDEARAKALGRKALARNPSCPFGVHAMAHAIAGSSGPAEAARWMREQSAQWERESGLRTHNAWHLAMFEADAGNYDSALELLDAWLLPATAASALDACDATALLWRLALEGIDVAARWRRVSEAFEHNVTPGFWPFIDLHAMLAHIAAGEAGRTARLAQAVARGAQGADYASLRARHITQPGFLALGAFAEGRYGDAATLLAGLRPILGYAGGSKVQLELFTSVEREAARRGGAAPPARTQRVEPRKAA